MNIETKITPNPETLKFVIGSKYILNKSGLEIKNHKEAKKIKFANEFFEINGIKSIFVGNDFVSVTKNTNITWTLLKTKILTFLLDYITANKVLVEEEIQPIKNKSTVKNKMSIDIKKIIDEKVRPAVAQDGGDIIFRNFDKGVVYLTLKGACAGCPSSTATLKQGIENLLMHYFPEVKEVKAIE